MHSSIKVLDHGYVQFIEAFGTGLAGVPTDVGGIIPMTLGKTDYEVGIIEAARQSTQGAFRGWHDADGKLDQKLLEFLYANKHMTPFEFSGMILEIQAPIFVFREWHRHRTQSYNEMSARYAPLPDLYYRPSVSQCIPDPADPNKQAASANDVVVSPQDAEQWINDAVGAYAMCEKVYQRGLRIGIKKEMARIVMPVGHYSKMRVAANLRNWLGFMTLRLHPNAQWQIRQYATAVEALIQEHFPYTHIAFIKAFEGRDKG